MDGKIIWLKGLRGVAEEGMVTANQEDMMTEADCYRRASHAVRDGDDPEARYWLTVAAQGGQDIPYVSLWGFRVSAGWLP